MMYASDREELPRRQAHPASARITAHNVLKSDQFKPHHTRDAMRYFLTLTERAAIIEEAVQSDTEYQAYRGLNAETYRAELESMNNYDLIQVCCNA